MANKKDINFFGETTFRNQRKRFGIKTDDRRRHIYTVGKTGMGKTAMLENMIIQDIQDGKGVGFVDPHGEAAEKIVDFIPKDRIKDVVYINPADLNYPTAFNIMEKVDPEYRHLVAGGLMGVFKKIWPDVWSARMEYILHNSILALLEVPDSTLLGVNKLLSDADYRSKVVDQVTDPVVKAFWVQEFAKYTQRYEVEATAAIQNKIGQFISAPLIRNIIGQVHSSLDIRKIMDEQKILIMNLSKGRIGEDNSRLLGALLITKLQLAAMSRIDMPEEDRKDFILYVDEFQNFATESFTNILSEARKYRLSLILAHQYIAQMEEEVRDAVFGNVGTLIAFRIGAEDAEFLEKEFFPDFTANDLVNLTKYNIYVKLMIDGIASSPFSAETLYPLPRPKNTYSKEIIEFSREKYGRPRKFVEEKIAKLVGVSEEQKIAAFKTSSPPMLYDAKCGLCGKDTKVIFRPDGKRPIYCKACLKKIKEGNDKKSSFDQKPPEKKFESFPTISLKEAAKKEPVSFSSKKSAEEERKPRKKIDLGGLRKILEKSLKQNPSPNKAKEDTEKNREKKSQNNNHDKTGTINPGETIKF